MSAYSAHVRELLAASSLVGLSDEGIEGRYERGDAAYRLFHALGLSEEERKLLITAISQSNQLLLSLTACNWADAVVILRQIAEASGNFADYRRIILQLGIQTTNGFEHLGEQKEIDDHVAAVAS